MANNAKSRKWTLVINNPLEAGLDHAAISELLHLFSPAYYCMADEIATTGTYHTHLFFYAPSAARFSTIKNRFPTAHIEKAYGSVQDNRAYIRKDGPWKDTEKAETSVPGTFEEWGEIPPERAEKHPEMFRLVQNIRDGMTTTEIIDDMITIEKAKYKGRNVSPALVRHITLSIEMINPNTLPTWIM